MKKNNLKWTACALAAIMGFTGTGIEAQATGNVGSVLPSAGIEFSLQDEDKSTSLSSLKEIKGSDLVEAVTIHHIKEEREQEIAVDGVFIAVGMRPNTEAFRETVGCDERGYLIAGEDCATDVPGIFAAGDIRTKALRQIVTAVSDGACAVASVEQYLGTK